MPICGQRPSLAPASGVNAPSTAEDPAAVPVAMIGGDRIEEGSSIHAELDGHAHGGVLAETSSLQNVLWPIGVAAAIALTVLAGLTLLVLRGR